METARRKKLTKKQFPSLKLATTTNGTDALDDFYAERPFVD